MNVGLKALLGGQIDVVLSARPRNALSVNFVKGWRSPAPTLAAIVPPPSIRYRNLLMPRAASTGKMNDIDPQAWLADVLARIAEHPVQKLDELLPWNWRGSSAQIRRAA